MAPSIRPFALAAALLLFGCGPAQDKCSSTNCVGCCDSQGTCQAGFTVAACGVSGSTCTVCSGFTNACQLGVCRADNSGSGGGGSAVGGGGGGAVGGGGGSAAGGGGSAAGGGGGSAVGGGGGSAVGGGGGSCPTLVLPASIPSTDWQRYDAYVYTTDAGVNTSARFLTGTTDLSALSFSLVRRPPNTTPTFPVSGTFTANVSSCVGCVNYMVCPPGAGLGGCQQARSFNAVAGSYTITRADTNASTGFLRGSIGPTRVVEWDYQANAPIGGGDCFDLTATTFEGHWP